MNTKTTALTVFAIFTTAGFLRAEGTNSPFKDDKEKTSYAIGLNVGGNWKRQEIEVDYDSLVRGLKDAAGGGAKLLTDDEVRETLTKFQQGLVAKQQEKQRVLAEKNKKEGEAFLAENKGKPGVVTLPNGLQYKILAEGSGDSPKPEDTVTVNYSGTLINGTNFDSSAKRGQPASFRLNVHPMRGWTEALALMKPGAKWQLFIPSDLAYGDRGGPQVEPGSTLLYELELVSAQPAPPRAPLTSDIIKVPSLEEMKKGAKIETIKAEDLEKLQKQSQEKK
jgi:FKBP-type peptidyl-prolyl cis-trans isomerase FklB